MTQQKCRLQREKKNEIRRFPGHNIRVRLFDRSEIISLLL